MPTYLNQPYVLIRRLSIDNIQYSLQSTIHSQDNKMNADQFAQMLDQQNTHMQAILDHHEVTARNLAQAMRPDGKKPREFSSGDPVDWSIWRRNFITTVEINGWNHHRSRRELHSSMVGEAAEKVHDIPSGAIIAPGDADAQPYVQLLDLYEGRFAPQAATDLTRAEVRSNAQKENESILAWHARMRRIFTRAYPGMTPAQIEANQDLRDCFILGLANPVVRKDTLKVRPVQYNLCLEEAQNSLACEIRLNTPHPGLPQPGLFSMPQQQSSPDIPAVHYQASPNNNFRCFYCNKVGHRRRDCSLWKASPQSFGAQRTRGRGGRGHQVQTRPRRPRERTPRGTPESPPTVLPRDPGEHAGTDRQLV